MDRQVFNFIVIGWSMLCIAAATDSTSTPSSTTSLERMLPAYALALNAEKTLNSSQCTRDLEIFKNAIDTRKLWALKMLDSSGQAKPGFVYGNNYWLGTRSQCFDTSNRMPFVILREFEKNASQYRKPEEEFPPFELNYFVANFRHNSTLQYHVRLPNEDLVTLGLCLPASCSTVELGLLLENIFQERTLMIGELYAADFKLETVRDLEDDHIWLINPSIVAVGLIILLTLILLILGTTYDILIYQKYLRSKRASNPGAQQNNNSLVIPVNESPKRTLENPESPVSVNRKEPSLLGEILQCFSIYTNTKIIFATKLGPDSVAQIHGLRFLGMVWIVMIHTIFYMSDYADNKPWSWRVSEGFAVQVISNATLSVDTFFFLSGFLVAYLYLKTTSPVSMRSSESKSSEEENKVDYRNKVKQFFGTVLKRFVRLTPAYMTMVGILQMNATWYGKTSQFYMTERPQEVCAKYWWRNLLYINNLFGRETMCMSWSWYLSNDMQFFIIGTFIVILSSIYLYTAAVILALILLSSTLITGYISYILQYVPTMDQQYHMLDQLYDPPWTRIGPYIVGIVTAYILFRLDNKLILERRNTITLWILGSACNVFVLFGLWERQISVLSSAIYVALSRTVWAVGLAWLLIACSTGHGGIINRILTFKGWVPLSKLTYCAYLLNPFIINSVYLHSESAMHIDFLPNGTMFLGNLAITYLCSYAYSLMMETPYVLIMRLLMKQRRLRNR